MRPATSPRAVVSRFAALLGKERRLLARDKAGLAIVFFMPMALVLIVTVIQDATFRSVNETRVPILLADFDGEAVGSALRGELARTGFFELHDSGRDLPAGEAAARDAVAAGRYLLAVVVPKGTTLRLRERAAARHAALLGLAAPPGGEGSEPPAVRLYFDPVTKQSFKTTVAYAVRAIVGATEMRTVVEGLADGRGEPAGLSPLIAIEERYAAVGAAAVVPNAVQHNIPAWTMFAMFFIALPLASGMIRERRDGTGLRLRTMPCSALEVLAGKAAVYLGVCLAQALLMLAVGRWALPLLGLPALRVAGSPWALAVVVLASGCAAIGYGVAVGAAAETEEQASSFGAVSVIILAAVGGVFVPVFVMPPFMRRVSVLSPLNWGLEGFSGVFLRGADLAQVLPQALRLLLFGAVFAAGALAVRRVRDAR